MTVATRARLSLGNAPGSSVCRRFVRFHFQKSQNSPRSPGTRLLVFFFLLAFLFHARNALKRKTAPEVSDQKETSTCLLSSENADSAGFGGSGRSVRLRDHGSATARAPTHDPTGTEASRSFPRSVSNRDRPAGLSPSRPVTTPSEQAARPLAHPH